MLRLMVTPAHMALECPVSHCKRHFNTNRAPDCLRNHLRDAKDEDHQHIYAARYPNAYYSTVYTCPICTKTFKDNSKLKRHNQGLHQDNYSKSRCPKCNKILKYPLKEHISRNRCKGIWGSKKSLSKTGKAKQATSQYPHTNTSPPSPDITAQQARQTARNEAGLRTHSALRKAPTDDDVGAATSILSQRTARAVLDANNPQPPPMSTINNVQHPSSTMDEAALVYTHHMSPEGCLNSIRHESSFPPTEAARYVGGDVGVTPQGPPHNSTAPNSGFTSPMRCHPNTGQDVPYNDYTADLRWLGVFGTIWNSHQGQENVPCYDFTADLRWPGVFGTTWNSHLGQEIVDQQWMESSGPACNSDFQGLHSHDQTVDQPLSEAFGSG
ncbi:hypothetical protein ABVK25_010781 [Lepraria finkii]|uniref:C2H2-type domain-containing protein n=1 Tax=Lepraria finkii TaxID=1340010 RepID=A0ABR4ATB1_9LECA